MAKVSVVKTEWTGRRVRATLSNGKTQTYSVNRLERLYGIRVTRSPELVDSPIDSSDESSNSHKKRRRRQYRNVRSARV